MTKFPVDDDYTEEENSDWNHEEGLSPWTRESSDGEILHERFSNRNFSFTSEIPNGQIPMWCTGTIDGQLFFFRIHNKTAELDVGFFELGKDIRDSVDFMVRQLSDLQRTVSEISSDSDLDTRLGWLKAFSDDVRNEVSNLQKIDQNVPNSKLRLAYHKNVPSMISNEDWSEFSAANLLIELIGELDVDEA